MYMYVYVCMYVCMYVCVCMGWGMCVYTGRSYQASDCDEGDWAYWRERPGDAGPRQVPG